MYLCKIVGLISLAHIYVISSVQCSGKIYIRKLKWIYIFKLVIFRHKDLLDDTLIETQCTKSDDCKSFIKPSGTVESTCIDHQCVCVDKLSKRIDCVPVRYLYMLRIFYITYLHMPLWTSVIQFKFKGIISK